MKPFLDLILPPLCIVCKSEGFFICENCRDSLSLQNYFVCPVCGRRDPEGRLDRICRKETGLTRFLGSPLLYQDEQARNIIHAFKYQHAKALAEPLADILIGFLQPAPPQTKGALLAPIPMTNFKERERGFNQATEIAKIVAAHYKLDFQEKIIAKIKNTSNQADIKDKKTRITNLEGAFSCVKPDAACGKIITLVDDVYTTGSTMRECARVLREAGAREVWGMTLAKG